MHQREIVSALRATLPELLVAADFDGTLAPLHADPEQSRPVAGAIAALAALSAAGARVAVITGRDAATVVRLGGLDQVPGLRVSGLYGLESWHDGTLETPEQPAAIATLRERLPSVLQQAGLDPAVWIEDKRLSLVVHARRADDPEAALAPLLHPVRALAADLRLEVHPGRDVLEIRVPGHDKAAVLRSMADGAAGVVYLGDDLGDLPAFAELAVLRRAGTVAFGVGVLASGVPGIAAATDLALASADDAVTFLRELAGA